ncbi:tRNA (adenosine(37)-N6)-dimethylallyltransferase MiaA [Dehalogenimonas sp. 4OHTPN]|uniref:tRNA dimethylallyltransferase n=1 Tax=Dehalogenimonas sp. 4OHTPN TaxID=3166643 RepID=A0AAU8G9I7_9CHLR
MNRLIAVVGPTGTGKSALAVELARKFDGAIINADSRQFSRHLDIGTAKLPIEERDNVPHYLIDIIEPSEDYNIAEFQKSANEIIGEVQSRKCIPILVGGSGLYVWSMLEGWQISKVPPDQTLRRALENRAREEGPEALYRQLDETRALSIDPRNIRRVIRALEIQLRTNQQDSNTAKKIPPPYRILVIGLTCNRAELYRRIDQRVDKMLCNGFVEEVESLLTRGFSSETPGFKSVGYKEAIEYLRGELDYNGLSERIKAETHRLVRQQYNWFRLSDNRIHWFDIAANEYKPHVNNLVLAFIKEEGIGNGFY